MGGWYLDNTRIYVLDMSVDEKVLIAKLNPLEGGSVYHYWGYEDEQLKIKVYVVGGTDRDEIKDMQRDGATHYLRGSGLIDIDYNFTIPVYVSDASWTAVKNLCQNLDNSQASTTPMWEGDITLFWDE